MRSLVNETANFELENPSSVCGSLRYRSWFVLASEIILRQDYADFPF